MRARWRDVVGAVKRPARHRPRRRLARVTAYALLAALPLAMWAPAAASAAPLSWPMPSLAGIRSWLSSVPSPHVPRQISGSAAGLAHHVPASADRAGHGVGRPPGLGRGELPVYHPFIPPSRVFHTGPGPAPAFDPSTSKLVASATTASSDLYKNADGTYTRLVYDQPVNYQDSSGAFHPIDTRLTPGTGGRWQEKANAFGVDFGARADDPALGSLGFAGSRSFSFGLAGSASVAGAASGSAVTYAGALPATDVVEAATGSGIKESLLLHSAAAASTWTFPLRLQGLTAVMAADGSVQLVDASGRVAGVIPHGFATDSAIDPRTGNGARTEAVTYQLISYHGGQALQVSLDKTWLDDPARVFPVTVDPSVNETASGSTYVLYPYTNDYSSDSLMQAGTYDSGTNYARAFYHFWGFTNSSSSLHDYHVTAASLKIFDAWAYSCSSETFYVNPITQSWNNGGNKSWPGPSIGSSIGTWTGTASTACPSSTHTAASASVGQWLTVGLSTSYLNGWTLGTTSNDGLAIKISTTNSYAYKQFDGYNSPYPPYIAVTYSADKAPQINSQYPVNNFSATSLTPELQASGSDADNWPSALTYRFTVEDAGSKVVAQSGWQSTPDWTVPSGKLAWNRTYYWYAQAYDNLDYSAITVNALSTPVPQPTVTSALSQNSGGRGFDPANSNYTTRVTDAKVPVVGPALSIQRDYNSEDLRTGGAFGAGWSSMLDMTVAPGLSDSSGTQETMIVNYPDGQQVGFGENPDGTFTAPPGRFAALAAITGGGYTLTDKNDTVYTFAQDLGADAGGVHTYGITSITDALGHALNFTWASGQITTITSAASGRSLHLTWSATTPSHVLTVATDPVTTGSSALTWTYGYSTTGDQLTSVCPPGTTTACTAYTYTPGTDYAATVQDTGPHSYWPLDEASGTTAASAVLVNEGADNGTYKSVTLGQPGPLSGSSETAGGFDGSTSYVALPPKLVSGATYQSVSLWFKTTATGDVLFSYSNSPITAGTTSGSYTPELYVGSSGYLYGEFWDGSTSPIKSSAPVNDGNWHQAVLVSGTTSSGTTEELYVDGAPAGGLTKTVENTAQANDYVGAGFIGGNWPDEPHQGQSGNTGYATFFNGDIADVAFWDRPVTAAEVSAMYQAAHSQASLLTTITRPSKSVYAQVAYDPGSGAVTQVTDDNGGAWKLSPPVDSGSSQTYVSSVLGAAPVDYWRFAESGIDSSGTGASTTGWADAVNEVNGGAATNVKVTQGTDAGPFTSDPADKSYSFDGSTSYVSLPDSLVDSNGGQSVSLWFKTSTGGGILFGYANQPLSNGTASDYTPALYLGPGGDLHGEFWDGSATPIMTSSSMADGKWHNAVLAASSSGQTLYVDGKKIGSLSATISNPGPQTYGFIGSGLIGSSWPNEPHSGSAAGTDYYKGDIGEVSFYNSELSAAQVAAEYQAYKDSSGATPVQTVHVTDPGGHTITYAMDPLNGNRLVSQTDALGGTTKYGYDTGGFLHTVVNPDGDTTTTGHDARGNMVSQTTCQNQAQNECSTSYYTYQGQANWNFEDGTQLWSSANATLAPSAGWVHTGQYAALLTAAGTGSDWSAKSPMVPVTPGEAVSAFAYVHASQALGQVYIGARWYGPGGTFISEDVGAKVSLAAGATTEVTFPLANATVVAPPGAATAQIVVGDSESSASGAQLYVDDVYSTAHLPQIGWGFEDGTDSWSAAYSAVAQSSGWAQTGHDSMLMTADGTGTSSWYARSPAIEVSPGAQLSSYAYVHAPQALGKVYIGYNWYDSSGAYLSSTNGASVPVAAGASAELTVTSATAPSGAASARTVVADSEASPSGTELYVDDVQTLSTGDFPNPQNDLLLTSRGPGSSSAADSTYLTSFTYDDAGAPMAETTPPVPGFPRGRTTTTTYSDGTSAYPAADSGNTPAGLPVKTVTPGGAVTTTQYNHDGDVAEVTDPDGLVTKYAYDNIGRLITKTVISKTYPNGLTTSYVYNDTGDVVAETDPPVTDHVTGATHTPQITTVYDADGDVTSQTVSDVNPLGGDASRAISNTYNTHDQLVSSTDAAGNTTSYTYDAYGNRVSETDPAGNVTDFAYDANGHLLTTTLENYTGNPNNPQSAAPLPESSRSYDPAGQLASVTNAMGFTTAYTYYDNGLLDTITRSDGQTGGASFVEQANTYNAANQLIQRTTNNGATVTDYAVDAAGRNTSVTMDPAGLDRTTTYTYSPDDQVVDRVLTGPGSTTPVRATSYTYDPMGTMTSESVSVKGGGGNPVGWWRLDQTSGTSVPDASGTGNDASAANVTWSGGAGTFNGSTSQAATSGPVLNTTGSFSVSAWVDMASAVSWEAAVSQDATKNSAFQLQYDSSTNGWAFGRKSADTSAPAAVRIASSNDATVGTWQFLTATYDASTNAEMLYVDGVQAATGSDTTPYPSYGPFVIGRGQYAGSATDWFDGSVSDVRAYQRVLSASEVAGLYQSGRDSGANSASKLTTTWTVGERGLPTSKTDPLGNVTHYAYDEAGHLAVTTYPAVSTQVYGSGAPAQVSPVTMTGYDTFGEPVETSDANGNVTTTAYDADGRAVSVTAPPYTQPGSSTAITPVTTTTYNSLGEVASRKDGLGNVTSYTYDQLGDVASQTAPDGGVTTYSYDKNGDQLSSTGPTGAVADATYDYLGRMVTSTQVESNPSAAYTTASTYGTNGWLASQTSPEGVKTSYGYDAAGETTSVTDGAGNTTGYSYNAAGQQTAVTYPDSTSTTTTFDEAGRMTGQADLAANGTVLRSDSAAYDANGDLLSTTDFRGNTTTFTYDALGHLSSESQPVTATTAVTTSYGYDPAGNQTLYTDGNGHNWWTTYNSWSLPQSRVEPATSAFTSAADGTFTTAYDANGNPVSVTSPGGVSVSNTYNDMGELTGQSGTGAEAATGSRSFGYDLAGNLTSAATTAAGSQPATTEQFTYDARGLMVSASGTAGSSSFTYNGDGQVTSVADAAGTTSYTYDSAGRLATLSDPLSGTTATYTYNPMSQVSQISYGSGNDVRTFGYNSLHQLTSDTLATAGGTTVASIGYGYDANGNLTSKATSGFAGASSNTYTYDQANRLTSWNNGSATVSYAYDGAGNRTQAGGQTFTYDARDELTSDGTSSYSYTARGTLASVAGPSGTKSFSWDAFGQGVSQAGQSYAYDALGRVVSISGVSGTSSLSYSGQGNTLASDGTWSYTWGPSGATLAAVGQVGGSAGSGLLAFTDQHTDVVGDFAAGGSSLSGSAAYDPWGVVTGSAGLAGGLGFQSEWTDPATGLVRMGARWYSPADGQFTSRDSVAVNPVPASAAANPFAYVGDNPMTGTDPTGHMLAAMGGGGFCSSSCQAQIRRETAPRPPSPPAPSCSWWDVSCHVSHAWHTVTRYYHAAARVVVTAAEHLNPAELARQARAALERGLAMAGHLARDVGTGIADAARAGAHVLGSAAHVVVSAGAAVVHHVTSYAVAGYHAVTHAVATAYHAVRRVATATVKFVKHHAAAITSVVVSAAVFIGCDAALGAATAGVGAVAGATACGALAGAAGNAAAYGVTAAQTGKFSLSALAQATAAGAVTGAVTGLAGGLGGEAARVAGGLLSRGRPPPPTPPRAQPRPPEPKPPPPPPARTGPRRSRRTRAAPGRGISSRPPAAVRASPRRPRC